MRKRLRDLLEQVPLKLFAVAILFIVSLLLFGIIADEAVIENENQFDQTVFAFFPVLSSASYIYAVQVFTFFGSGEFLLPAYILLIAWLIIKKKFRDAIDVSVVAVTSTALIFAMKEFFQRTRPESPLVKGITTFSFPSGHTVSSFIFSFILIHLVSEGKMRRWKKWLLSTALLLFSFLIGISRIILHVHYPTDVLAGFCFALVWITLSFWLLRMVSFKKKTL